MKTCPTCKKPEGPFGPRDPRCRPCLREKSAAYLAKRRNDPVLSEIDRAQRLVDYRASLVPCPSCGAPKAPSSKLCRKCAQPANRRGTLAKDGRKVCAHCQQNLPVSSFSKVTKAKDGLQSSCRDCMGQLRPKERCPSCDGPMRRAGSRCVKCYQQERLERAAARRPVGLPAERKPKVLACVDCGGPKANAYAQRCRSCVTVHWKKKWTVARRCVRCEETKEPHLFGYKNGRLRRTHICLACNAARSLENKPQCECGKAKSPSARTCMDCRDERSRRGSLLGSDGLKQCGDCLGRLSPEKFKPQARTKDGLNPNCIDCNRLRAKKRQRSRVGFFEHLRHNYRMTVEQWEALYATQGGRCAACERTLKTRAYDQENLWVGDGLEPHVDHDHGTGEVRGLLCKWCNLALSDTMTPDALRGLAAYLESWLTRHWKRAA